MNGAPALQRKPFVPWGRLGRTIIPGGLMEIERSPAGDIPAAQSNPGSPQHDSEQPNAQAGSDAFLFGEWVGECKCVVKSRG